MKCTAAGLTDPGMVRPYNQDSYHIDSDNRFFIVADGMGGHAAGQEASRIAKDTICQYLEEKWSAPQSSEALLEEAFLAANQAILADQKTHPEREDMGTTAVAVMVRDGEVWCANLGDSRIYRWRDSEVEQMTHDDTWVAQAVAAGHIDPGDARSHPLRHVLAQCLGREDLGEVEVRSVEAKAGDRFLLCSDGLTEELPDPLIASYMQSSDLEQVTNKLVSAAKEMGGRDNITVVVARFEA